MQVPSLSFLGFLLVTLVLCLSVGRGSRQAGRKVLALARSGLHSPGRRMERVCRAGGGDGGHCRGALVSGKAGRPASPFGDGDGVPLAHRGAGGVQADGWMPLGISFFTFQQLWLLKEAYTGQYRRSQGDSLLLYTFFFPTVTSGPILRPEEFFPQLREAFLCPSWGDAAAGLYAISFGMAKKVLLADPLGAVVSNGWALGQELTAPAAGL